ncbi:MAG: PadR family transcriptional regulator [Acidimicrobiia bacterium]|nr:PadR family transcriptional regulator [Acidimicrobiia bacterium]
MTTTPMRRSPLAMMALSLLSESPMHAYRMQQMIRERDKESVVNIGSPNSLHQVLKRLESDGMVVVREVSESERGPRRTVYEITALGNETLREWLTSELSTPRNEYPNFPAALSLVPHLSSQEVATLLEERARNLDSQLTELDPQKVAAELGLERVFLVEDEYRCAIIAAELGWVRRLVDDLRSGELPWPNPDDF